MRRKLKNIILLSALIGIVTFVFSIGNGFGDITDTGASSTNNTLQLRFLKYNEETKPVEVVIPKLNVEADVEQVGKTVEGRMDIPKDENNLAWWKYGAGPGEQGSVVLAGHIDRSTGGPGIFYALDTMEIGDTIQVFDDKGKEYEYVVTRKEVYSDENFPLERVFKSNKKSLNLITCEGIYDRARSNYTQRLVVYTELRQPGIISF